MTLHVTVNGAPHVLEVAANVTLLDFLRDRLRLTGTKECCDLGECGACTVLVSGRSVNSCLMLALEAEGGEVTTIEGLADGDTFHPMQQAFHEHHALQCGFCIPGQVMAAHHLLQRIPHPTVEEVRDGLSGNLCRCGGYVQICEAVLAAAESGS